MREWHIVDLLYVGYTPVHHPTTTIGHPFLGWGGGAAGPKSWLVPPQKKMILDLVKKGWWRSYRTHVLIDRDDVWRQNRHRARRNFVAAL